jgi:hypothetical protein
MLPACEKARWTGGIYLVGIANTIAPIDQFRITKMELVQRFSVTCCISVLAFTSGPALA